jgi:DNA-binding MurR/RpiR family transcriptional regulator
LPAASKSHLAEATAVLARISATMPSLARSDAAVASTIAADPERVVTQSITELAEAAGTSASSVVRCSQSLGFSGFQDLRLALARELGAVGTFSVPDRRGDAPQQVLEYMLTMQVEAIRSVPATLDAEEFEAAAEAIARAGHVVFAGVGSNLGLIQDAGYVGRSVGLRVDAPVDVYSQQTAASLLGSGDACLTISQTGSSRDSVTTQEMARDAGATTIALTGFLRSPLTAVSDHCLVAGNPTVSYDLEAIPTRMAMKAVLDALLLAVALRNRPRTDKVWKRVTAIQLRHVY